MRPSLVRRAERVVQHDAAALGAKRYPHRIGENVDALQHLLACIARKFDCLGSHLSSLLT